MKLTKLIPAAIAAVLLIGGASAHAQSYYPTRAVRVVVPFPPGGATDIVARLVAERLQAALGKPFVVDNKAGASGNIGIGEVVRAAPDGYTLVLGSPQTLTINPQLFANLPFNPQKDLAPIVVLASVPNVLLVNNQVPAKTPEELIALAKLKVGKLSYGSSSIGGTPHLSAELFKSMTGTSILHIPYRGSAPALQDLIGGQIDMIFDNLPAALPQIRAGTVRALAVTTLKRASSAPNLPTLHERGITGFESEGWFALLAPAGTPRPILDRLNLEVNKALATPELRERLEKAGADPVGGSIESFQQRIDQETQRWARVIKFANIKAE
jgi:tripartite-type tricarboxylate transporter receptor subunit TctC